MDEIIEGLAESIGGFYTDFFSGLQEVVDIAGATPQEFNSTIWNAVSVHSPVGQAVVVVASTITALFILMELISLYNRSDVKGLDAVQMIFGVCFKAGIAILLCKNMTVIIGACFEITEGIINSIGSSMDIRNFDIDISGAVVNALKDEGSFWILLKQYLIGFLGWLVNNIALVLVKAISALRFIEIYVFTAVAPLAFATFCSTEHKTIGVKFIKRMIALGLQGLFLIIICYIYTQLIVAAFPPSMDISQSEITGKMFELMGYSILVIIAAFQSGGWSKALVDVN